MTIAALEGSMSWLVAAPLRNLGAASQAVGVHIRRAAKLVWRLLTSVSRSAHPLEPLF